MTILLTLGTLAGCGNDDEQMDCNDCNSPTSYTIPDTSCFNGTISFQQENSELQYYTNHFWITVHQEGAVLPIFIVCNEDLIEQELKDEIELSGIQCIAVQFSGHVKDVCNAPIGPAIYSYHRIVLTKIYKQ